MIICREPVASSVAFNCRQAQNLSYGVKASLLYILFHMTLLASLYTTSSLSMLTDSKHIICGCLLHLAGQLHTFEGKVQV